MPDICSLGRRVVQPCDAGVDYVELLASDRDPMKTSAEDFDGGLRGCRGMAVLCVASELRWGLGGMGTRRGSWRWMSRCTP